MANLEEMREFTRHWRAFCAEDEHLSNLCGRVPVDTAKLTESDRGHDLFSAPESVAYCDEAFANVLAVVLTGANVSVTPADAPWGWWLEDEDWQAYASTKELMAGLTQKLDEIAAIDAERREALDADDAYREAAGTVETYRASNAEDTATCTELARRLENLADAAEPHAKRQKDSASRLVSRLAVAAAVTLACGVALWSLSPDVLDVSTRVVLIVLVALVCALVALRVPQGLAVAVRRRGRLADERDRLKRALADVDARVALRAEELKVRAQEADARKTELEEPFLSPRTKLIEECAHIERDIIDALDDDLAKRDAAYAAGTLAELPFDEAYRSAQEREWALLGSWMGEYLVRLPHEIEHTLNARASEEVWLESHDPFGKRWWELSPKVLKVMEDGNVRDSDAALEIVLQDQEHRAE